MIASQTYVFKYCTALALVALVGTSPLVAETSSEASRLIADQQFEEALAVLAPLIQVDPEDAFLLRLQGYALFKVDRNEESITALKKAVQLAPDDPAALFFLGNSFAASNRLSEAREAFEQVIEVEPGSDYARVVEQLLPRIDALEMAEQDRKEAAASTPDTIEVLVEVPVETTPEERLLALVLADVDAGDFSSALPRINQLLLVFPDHFEIQKLKGLALMEIGETSSAISHFTKLRESHPHDSGIRLLLAQALVKDGQLRLAVSELSDLLEIGDLLIVDASESLLALVNEELREIQRDTWTVISTLGISHDSNPSAVPVTGGGAGTPSWVSTASLIIGYELLDQTRDEVPFSVQVLGVGQESFHHDRSLERLDVSYGSLGLHFQHDRKFLARPLTIRAGSDWTAMDRGGSDYFQSNEANISSDWRLSNRGGITLGYRFARHDFADDTVSPEFFSLDGDTHVGSVGAYLFIFEEKALLSAGYAFSDADLEGSQFASEGHSASISLRIFLPWQMEAVGEIGFSREDYDGFLPSPTRLDNIVNYSMAVEKQLWESDWKAVLSYSKINADSNQPFFDFRREIVGIGFRYSF